METFQSCWKRISEPQEGKHKEIYAHTYHNQTVETKDKVKILKAAREKWSITF